MKKVSHIVGLIGLLAVVLTSSAFTGQCAESLPIVFDQGAIREHALPIVKYGTRIEFADSLDWNYPGTQIDANATGKNAEEVLSKLFQANLNYQITNRNDTIHGRIYLYDANYNLVFYGSVDFTYDTKSPRYFIWLYRVPILSGVASSEVLALKKNGDVGEVYELETTYTGQVNFQPWYAGPTNGLLNVRYLNGTSKLYFLYDPNRIVRPDNLESKVSGIEGHTVYTDVKTPVKILTTYELPTTYHVLTQSGKTPIDVQAMVYTGNQYAFERPYAIVITPEDGGPSFTRNLDVTKVSEVHFDKKGNYRARYKFNKFGSDRSLYAGEESTKGDVNVK